MKIAEPYIFATFVTCARFYRARFSSFLLSCSFITFSRERREKGIAAALGATDSQVLFLFTNSGVLLLHDF